MRGLELDLSEIKRQIGALACGRANDAVKLVLLDPEDREIIDKLDLLDLSLLSEVKRGANGVIEVKILNRLSALELLAKLEGAEAKDSTQAESFYNALDRAAEKSRGGDEP